MALRLCARNSESGVSINASPGSPGVLVFHVSRVMKKSRKMETLVILLKNQSFCNTVEPGFNRKIGPSIFKKDLDPDPILKKDLDPGLDVPLADPFNARDSNLLSETFNKEVNNNNCNG